MTPPEKNTPPPSAKPGAVLTSVVIVNYNAGDLLTRCVGAVLSSNIPVEVWVVDNASSDGSIATLLSFHGQDGRLTIIKNDRNLGFAAANNIALAKVSGEFILLLNPDCLIRPDTIARVQSAMAARPEAGMAGPVIRNEDGSEQVGCRRDIPTLKTAFFKAFGLSRLFGVKDFNQTGAPMPEGPEAVEAISGAFMLVRRIALLKVGPMDEGYFLHCEDLDWCLRFTQAGYSILFIPSVEALHYQGTCGADIPLEVELHKSRGMTRFFRKFHGGGPLYWVVAIGVWARYSAMVVANALRRS